MIATNKQKCKNDCGFFKFVILSGTAIVIARPRHQRNLAVPLRYGLSVQTIIRVCYLSCSHWIFSAHSVSFTCSCLVSLAGCFSSLLCHFVLYLISLLGCNSNNIIGTEPFVTDFNHCLIILFLLLDISFARRYVH